MELWIGSVNLGLLYALMAIGVFITFRIQDFADITVDGSFTTGAAVSAVMILAGIDPVLSLGAAFLAGALAGAATGLIHTKLKVNSLLAGILVMIALYSINLHIMQRSNIPLLDQPTIISLIGRFNPGINSELWLAIILMIMMLVFWQFLSFFFKTDLGLTIRTTGDNAIMTSASGINVDKIKILGVALANGMVGMSGGTVAQYQGFADIGMGIGTVVIGLASVIVGEAVIRKSSIGSRILSAIIGSIVFRFMIAFALYVGMNPIDLKLLTALFVLFTIVVSRTISGKKSIPDLLIKPLSQVIPQSRALRWSAAAALVLAVIGLGFHFYSQTDSDNRQLPRIGLVLVNQDGYVGVTLDGFKHQIDKLGWHDGENCRIILSDANNDLPTLSTIADKFQMDSVDVIVSIGTPATQAVIGKVKSIPVVFSALATPYVIGAGKSTTDHLPNVTGIYGNIDMDHIVRIAKIQFPGRDLRIGTIWDQAHANSVFNVGELKKAIARNPEMKSVSAMVSGSSEVHQVTTSIINRGIDLIIQPPDNTVFSAFDAMVSATRSHKIPIILSDHQRLIHGGLLSFGYDYYYDGVKTARLVDRILRGENPQNIPFEEESKDQVLHINLKVAKELGITIRSELLAEAGLIIDEEGRPRSIGNQDYSAIPAESDLSAAGSDTIADRASGAGGAIVADGDSKPKRVAIFFFSEQQIMLDALEGVKDVLKSHNLILDVKSAQGEYSIGKSVADGIVQAKYDYIVTLSTPSLQIMASTNRVIPHIFGCVTNPYQMELATDTIHHRENITGVVTLQPVESAIKLMREVFPTAKRIGIIWNPAEVCSQTCCGKAKLYAPQYGFTLLERNVTNTNEVAEALNSLLTDGIDLFFMTGDNTVALAIPTLASRLRAKKIPFFTNSAGEVAKGAFISLGAEYYQVGVKTGEKALQVIGGRHPKDVPLTEFVPERLEINHALVKEYGVVIPKAVLDREAAQ
ncbi:MAG: hypothetical protein KBA26_10595 [Candidatus Delongbacteria bacterium]|nr:hypothetical protein [Candidatus Delongbacteria bacterium]